MNHLENLIRQYYEWKGYIVRSNIKVGRLSHGGWEGELDVVAYNPDSKEIIHLEPSIDANTWERREERFSKKFKAGKKYICKEVFPWLPQNTPLQQIAVLITSTRKKLAGGEVVSIDDFIGQIKAHIEKEGKMQKGAIPEEYDLLRTIQLVINGYGKKPK